MNGIYRFFKKKYYGLSHTPTKLQVERERILKYRPPVRSDNIKKNKEG